MTDYWKMSDYSNYNVPKSANWNGRYSKSEEYWYQKIDLLDLQKMVSLDHDAVILGYACDEGVRRNQGRVGAKQGPSHIRQAMGGMTWHQDQLKIADGGDVSCNDGDMERAQTTLGGLVSKILSSGAFPIVIGGGHDMAFGTFQGVWNHLCKKEVLPRMGIINFDAHYDLRPMKELGNSGTPFTQIARTISDTGAEFYYMCIGIQKASNTIDLFKRTKKLGVQTISQEDLALSTSRQLIEQIIDFLNKVDYIYLSIDLDGFTSAIAPGVSAPSPLGLNFAQFLPMFNSILESEKLMIMDIAEMNPQYDIDHTTSRLAARIIHLLTRSLVLG